MNKGTWTDGQDAAVMVKATIVAAVAVGLVVRFPEPSGALLALAGSVVLLVPQAVPWWLLAAAGVLAVLFWAPAGTVFWWLVRHPATMIVGSGSVFFAAWIAPLYALVWWSWLACVIWAWHDLWPASYHAHIAPRFWTGWREIIYGFRWREVMLMARLAGTLDGNERIPYRLRMRSTRNRDEVAVELLPAQTLEDWEKRANALAEGVRATRCTVRRAVDSTGRVRPGYARLTFLRGDPLVKTQRAPALSAASLTTDSVDLAAVDFGRTELGERADVPVVRGHLLAAGATDSGKSSFGWSVLGGTAPAMASGRMEWWGIDPKGNELSLGRPLFTRYARPELDANNEISEETARPMVALLVDAAHLALQRGEEMGGDQRQHIPSPGDPAIGIWLDEIVWFAKVMPYPELRKEFFGAFGVLLSQGRSASVSLMVMTQDARKEVVPARHFFARRLQFRCAEVEEVKWSLGDKAYDRGARADEIPEAAPGVGYMTRDSSREITRIRPDYWADDDVLNLAKICQPPATTGRGKVINTTSRVPQDDLAEDPFDFIGTAA